MPLLDEIYNQLRQQGLGDLSGDIAAAVVELLLWKPEQAREAVEPQSILAFSFGFKFDDNGNRQPGRANEELARKVLGFYQTGPVPVYAQWEIAMALGNGIPPDDLHIIRPTVRGMRAPNDPGVDYLSSRGVVERAQQMGAKGPVLVVAHRYHLWRCAKIVTACGLAVVAHPDKMPAECDPASGQLWTRSNDVYILSDMVSRLAARRDRLC